MDIQIAKPGQWWGDGTSLVGYFDARWTDLNSIFGPMPVHEPSYDEKVTVHITLRLDREVVTLYDYKATTPPGFTPNATYKFHIGGHTTKAVEKLKEYFESIGRQDLAQTTIVYGK